MNKLILSGLMLGLLGSFSYAQSPWLSDSETNKILVEWDKMIFSHEREFNWREVISGSTVFFITGELGITENASVMVELPFSYYGYMEEFNVPLSEYERTIIGNIYIGGKLHIERSQDPDHHMFVELGVRLPTTPEPGIGEGYAHSNGLQSELSDRFEAFAYYNDWSIPLIGNYVRTIRDPVAIKFRLGTIWVERKKSENMLFLLYGLTGLYRTSAIEGYLGINGRSPYYGNNPIFFDDGISQLRAGVGRPFNEVVPSIYIRKTLGENYNQIVDWGYGINIEYRW